MPRFAANLSLLYAELPFVERFAAAAGDGFAAVECQFPYAVPAAELAQRLADSGLQQVLINAPAGDAQRGERGLGCLPGRQGDFRRALLEQALPYASALRCRHIHVMAGVLPAGVDRAEAQAVYLGNLAWAAPQAASAGIDLLIEPLNTRDTPGYFLTSQQQAHDIVAELGAPNLQVQMDLYHCQIMEGDITVRLRAHLPGGRVGHLQTAGVPERHEPDSGELQHAHLFALVDSLGWQGHIGCEYRPRDASPGGTSRGLGWFQPYKDAQR